MGKYRDNRCLEVKEYRQRVFIMLSTNTRTVVRPKRQAVG
jgi:hypothetical protein